LESQWWKLKVKHLELPVVVEGMLKTGSENDPEFILYDSQGEVKFRTPRTELRYAEPIDWEQAEQELLNRTATIVDKDAEVDEHGLPTDRPPPRLFRIPEREAGEELLYSTEAVGTVRSIFRFGIQSALARMAVAVALVIATAIAGWAYLTPHHLRTRAAYELFAEVRDYEDVRAWKARWATLIDEATAAKPVFEEPRPDDSPFVEDLRFLAKRTLEAQAAGGAVGRWNSLLVIRDDIFHRPEDTEEEALRRAVTRVDNIATAKDREIAAEVDNCYKAEGRDLERCLMRVAERRDIPLDEVNRAYGASQGW